MSRSRSRRVSAGVLVTLLAVLTPTWAQLPRSMPAPRPAPSPVEIHAPQVGEEAPDFSLPDQHGLPVTLSEQLEAPVASGEGEGKKGSWVLLVFYRGYWCPHCNADLRALQNHLGDFTGRGVQIIAVSTDPIAVTRKHSQDQGYAFTFLSDMNAEVSREYALLREGEGLRRHDVARPAQFLIDSNGIVRWVSATDDHSGDRLRPDELFQALDRLGRTAPP